MSESIQTRFETHGDINAELVSKIGRSAVLSPKRIRRLCIGFALLLLDAILLFRLESKYAWMILVGAVIFAALWLIQARRAQKITVNRFLEQAPDGINAYTTSFSDEKLHIHNHTSGGSGTIALSNITRIFMVDDVWVLFTKSGLFSPVFQAQLSKTDRESVLALLKSKNPKLKIEVKEKK